MSTVLRWGAAGCGPVAVCFLAVATAAAEEWVGNRPLPVVCLGQLERLSWPELEQLYLQSEAGAIPQGYTPGKPIYCPCDKHVALKSKLVGMAWHGKVFNGADCTLVNQWCGFRAIKARVYHGPSCLDGKTSIIMDYSQTSKVWVDVRDEVREVAPGLYLGRMYRRKADGMAFQCYFILEACSR